MELERLETLKDSAKSKVYLVFDTENRRILVEKYLKGDLPIYQRLMKLPHPYLPKLYEVHSGPEETVVVSGFVTWGYVTDTDFQGALEIVLSSQRASVFRDADIPVLKRSQAKLALFAGNEQEAYQELLTVLPENLSYISTGYCDENGSLLLGGFETSFSIQYGILHYRSFQGLYAASQSGYRCIPPESCSPYAPAVLALYQLSVFDDW